MRISIPSIPNTSSLASIDYTLAQATDVVSQFLQRGNGKTLVMTGAGVSVDSGIAPYRGEGGHYTIHKTYRPIFYPEFIDPSPKGHAFRQRYWSRSFLGFKPVQYAQPNPTHYAIAALQRMGHLLPSGYITQNVDGLHHAATPSPSLAADSILELHGTLHNVVCVSGDPSAASSSASPRDPARFDRMSASHLAGPRRATPRPYNTPTGEAYPHGCGFQGSRVAFQQILEENNPQWEELARDMREKGTEPQTNPDGDVQLGNNVDYSTFKYPPCPNCGGVLKPAVIFFGESVPPALRDRSYSLLDEASALLIAGSSLATYSAFRLVKHAIQDRNIPVLLLNKGPTRADPILRLGGHASEQHTHNTEDFKVELGSSDVLVRVGRELARRKEKRSGSLDGEESSTLADPVLQRLLSSGVVVPATGRKGRTGAVVSS